MSGGGTTPRAAGRRRVGRRASLRAAGVTTVRREPTPALRVAGPSSGKHRLAPWAFSCGRPRAGNATVRWGAPPAWWGLRGGAARQGNTASVDCAFTATIWQNDRLETRTREAPSLVLRGRSPSGGGEPVFPTWHGPPTL
ncbi:hypothetical protein GCM10009527_069330 [Actinomadura nitritigenes]